MEESWVGVRFGFDELITKDLEPDLTCRGFDPPWSVRLHGHDFAIIARSVDANDSARDQTCLRIVAIRLTIFRGYDRQLLREDMSPSGSVHERAHHPARLRRIREVIDGHADVQHRSANVAANPGERHKRCRRELPLTGSQCSPMFADVMLAQSVVDPFKNSVSDFVVEGESYRNDSSPQRPSCHALRESPA